MSVPHYLNTTRVRRIKISLIVFCLLTLVLILWFILPKARQFHLTGVNLFLNYINENHLHINNVTKNHHLFRTLLLKFRWQKSGVSGSGGGGGGDSIGAERV